ncbi:DNA polymerase III subunit epsilon [Succinivibrio dextrinosolvens]|uniref:DNA polymerase III subunit epsilon n=1 Tax=Succinivibrio dextrinosolvens TaxID=83771 RepID=UPI001EEF000F|nr:DNA polymerase III subunit epsilon [Succinivibrio dextrinosolvens]
MKRQVALDTETTGKSDDGTPGEHRIIEVGCVEIIDRKITGRNLQLYVNPGRHVDDEAFKVHGISDEFLADKPNFEDVAHELIDFIRGSELLIHNAKFDVGFMDKEWMLMGLNEKTSEMANVIDTVSLAMKLCPGHQVNLDNLCNIYEVDRSSRTLHGALLDAQILAEVYLAMTGGQASLNFSEEKVITNEKWIRPEGVKLPVMPLSEECHTVHMEKMLSLAQTHMIRKGEEGQPSIAGSDWSDDFDMELLVKGEDEKKSDFKKRLSDQKKQMIEKILTPQQREVLQEFKNKDNAAQEAWLDRVLGRKK